MAETNANNERLLTRAEVEERFGIPKRYLELAACRGEGPPIVRISRMVRHQPSDVRNWIEKNIDPQPNSSANQADESDRRKLRKGGSSS